MEENLWSLTVKKENLCFLPWIFIINKKESMNSYYKSKRIYDFLPWILTINGGESLVSYREFFLWIKENISRSLPWILTMNQRESLVSNQGESMVGFLLWMKENLWLVFYHESKRFSGFLLIQEILWFLTMNQGDFLPWMKEISYYESSRFLTVNQVDFLPWK